MTITELIAHLHASWPWPSIDDMRAAAADYRAILGDYAGDRLAEAYRKTIADWRSAKRPLPGDILAQAQAKLRAAMIDTRRPSPPPNPRLEEAKRRKVELVAAWWEAHGAAIAERSDAEGFAGAEAASFRRQIEDLIATRAWTVAQHLALGHAAEVTFAPKDLEDAVERTISQRGIGDWGMTPRLFGRSAGDAARQGSPQLGAPRSPRHVPRTMVERYSALGLDPNDAPRE